MVLIDMHLYSKPLLVMLPCSEVALDESTDGGKIRAHIFFFLFLNGRAHIFSIYSLLFKTGIKSSKKEKKNYVFSLQYRDFDLEFDISTITDSR